MIGMHQPNTNYMWIENFIGGGPISILPGPAAAHFLGSKNPHHLPDPLPQGFIRRLRSLNALDELLRCHGYGRRQGHRLGRMLGCMGALGGCLGSGSRLCLPGGAFLLLLLLCCAPHWGLQCLGSVLAPGSCEPSALCGPVQSGS